MFVYTAEEIAQIDREAEEKGFPLFTLMENAGRSLFEHIRRIVHPDQSLGILCGRGNNGGDGIVLARYLQNEGYEVELIFPLGEPKSSVAKAHLTYYRSLGYSITPWDKRKSYDYIVDALLGVGTRLPLRSDVAEVVDWANSLDSVRIAIDLPTGVLANSGEVSKRKGLGSPFRADYTFLLHGFKPSRFLAPASSYYGSVDVLSIGLPQRGKIKLLKEKEIRKNLPKRPSDGHKGTFGTGLLIAGTKEMPGSVTLSAIGAIRSGLGKLIVATEKEAVPIVASHVPEATFLPDGLKQIAEGYLPDKVKAVGIGPGLVNQTLIEKALAQLFTLPIPIVLDAGALTKRDSYKAKGPVILTPHPGEFSRMTGYSTAKIAEDRIALAKAYAEMKGVTIVLKGSYTVIAFPDGEVFLNETGNTGLSKGGSGDVLTGMLTSFLSYDSSIKRAVTRAVYLHGLCADQWAQTKAEGTMTASDFSQLLPQVMKKIEDTESNNLR